jgi:hypothetical protein
VCPFSLRLFMWVGTPLANSPCIAFERTTSFSLRFLKWVPLFPTHLALPLGSQAILKKLSRSQNCSLSSIRHVFFPSAPLCGCFRAFHVGGCTSCQLALHCVWVPCLFSLQFLIWAPLLPTRLDLRLGA